MILESNTNPIAKADKWDPRISANVPKVNATIPKIILKINIPFI